MMQTDVKSAECAAAASTTAFNGPARAKAIAISHGATPGTVTIKDRRHYGVFLHNSGSSRGRIHAVPRRGD